MVQIRFDNNSINFETTMALLCNLIYHIERLGEVNVTRLAPLFTLMNLRTTHPSVHEALTPMLMDGSITLEALEMRLHYFYEMQAMHSPDVITFPALATPSKDAPYPHTSAANTIALPASIPL